MSLFKEVKELLRLLRKCDHCDQVDTNTAALVCLYIELASVYLYIGMYVS